MPGWGTEPWGTGSYGSPGTTSGVHGDVYGDVYGSNYAAPPPVPAAPAARPIVEVGFSTDPTIGGGVYGHWSDPQRGVWGVSQWAPDDIWTDVTASMQTCSWRRGATRVEGPVLRYETGTATITFVDFDARFNPLNLAGLYVSGTRSQVRPMVPVRIRVAFGDAGSEQVYDLFRGDADSWQIEYPSPEYARVTLTATDAQKRLSRQTRIESGTAVGGGELAGARVNRVLDSVGWPAADRIVAAGETALQATTLPGDPWTELLLVQDSEIGEVYLDAVGKLVFRGRYAALEDPVSTISQGIFGSDRAAGELPYAALAPNYDDTTIRNVVRIGREGGVPQEARDQISVDEFTESTHERSDLLMTTDAEALYYAQYLCALAKDPQLLFTELVVDPRAQPADLFPQVLQRDFGHRITVRSRPPGLGLVERDVYIRGIAGEYGGTNRWRWTWTLQPASASTFALWDLGKWNASVWVF